MSILESIDPAIDKFAQREYPLEPDLINGWRFKLKGFRKMIIKYSYLPVDRLVKEYTQLKHLAQYRILYLGPRNHTNLKALKSYCHKQYDAKVKESFLYSKEDVIKYPFNKHKQKDKTLAIEQIQSRIFTGMNPTIDCEDQIIFDSDFECGNLDLVMKIGSHEYDLFMRVDTNTKGHTSWYFFKIKNTRKGMTIKFNICNFHKKNSLYSKGMKPYVFSRLDGKGWNQAAVSTTYEKKNLRYKESRQYYKPLYCLSFNYTFQFDYDQLYFSYGIPYSYSYLLKYINNLLEVPSYKPFIKYQKKYESVSGLSVPVLTITNPSNESKKIILITGRLHPGQTQGSWVLEGFINFLCSPEGEEVRNIAIFKIIPMVNVDGVILGNFRTSLRGSDLNRRFKTEQKPMKDDEVGWVKNLAHDYNKSIHTYLDFHGHSTNKGAFLYGPQYPMNHQNYFNCRLFPKMINKETQMFRYYSCNFRIPKNKQTTARAIMFRENNVPFCFTIQTSNYSYYSHQDGQFLFNKDSFLKLGTIIGYKQQQFMSILQQIELKKEYIKLQRKRKTSMNENKTAKKSFFIQKINRSDLANTHKNKIQKEEVKHISQEFQGNSDQLLENIYAKHNYTVFKQEIEEEKLQTSNLQLSQTSSESSDCETERQDYTEKELQQILSLSITKKQNQRIIQKLKQKSISPEFSPQKNPAKLPPKKRSTSYRLPPTQPLKQIVRKGQPQQYKMSPRTLSIDSRSGSLGAQDFLIQRSHIRKKSLRMKQIIHERSRSKMPSFRKFQHIQSQKSRQLRSENISVELVRKIEQCSNDNTECFIYKHVKMLVFPEVNKSPPSNRSLKGSHKRGQMNRIGDSILRKELIWKRNNKSINIHQVEFQY